MWTSSSVVAVELAWQALTAGRNWVPRERNRNLVEAQRGLDDSDPTGRSKFVGVALRISQLIASHRSTVHRIALHYFASQLSRLVLLAPGLGVSSGGLAAFFARSFQRPRPF
ncbi:hypothetical protein G7046_g5887 [Stylonectria norvegica]|nr:hypothetical protein G7046_g5887 [Stylonectria norvegica]